MMKFLASMFVLFCLSLNILSSAYSLTYGGTGGTVIGRSNITAEPSERNVRFVVFPVSLKQ